MGAGIARSAQGGFLRDTSELHVELQAEPEVAVLRVGIVFDG